MSFGDPGSCSRLGAALCRAAGRLAEHTADLDAPTRELVAEVVSQLEAAGSRLQVHAQEVAELTARASRLRARAAAGPDLDAPGLREHAPLLEADERRASRALQEQADRVAARLGRCRAELVRRLRGAGEQLDLVSSRTRARAGTGIG